MRYTSLLAATLIFFCSFAPVIAASAPGSKAYVGNSFDSYFLKQTPPANLIAYDGQDRDAHFNSDGSSGADSKFLKGNGDLEVESQRVGLQVVQAGIITASSTLIDTGLKAIEWGLQPSVLGADGSFPQERDTDTAPANAIHPKTEYIEAAAQTVVLIGQSNVDPSFKKRAKALIPAIHLAAQHLIDSGDADAFFAIGANSSQMAFVAVAIGESGLISGDQAQTAKAQSLVNQIIALQYANGAYKEQDSYDTSYQMNTLELLTTYASSLTDPTWHQTVMNSLQQGANWFVSRVQPDGSIDTSGNSRTDTCGDPILGPGPKGVDVDAIPTRLYYYGYLAGTVPTLGPIADSIENAGYNYDHTGKCPAN